MSEAESERSHLPCDGTPRAVWMVPIPGTLQRLYQVYNRRGKRMVIGSMAIVLILLINTYFARIHGATIYRQLREQAQAYGFSSPPPEASFEDTIKQLFQPLKLPITAKNFTDQDGALWEISRDPTWTEPLKNKIAIIDCDNRPHDDAGEIMYPHPLLWKDLQHLSAGMLSHYMYSVIHDYDYRLYRSPRYPDRGANWAKVIMTIEALKAGYEYVLFIDSDAQITNPGVPLEWLFNRWNLTTKDIFSIAEEPDLERDHDQFGKRGLNTGFYIVRNDARAYAILKAWAECPTRYDGCEKWTHNPLMEQTAFCDYVRYDPAFRNAITVLPCNEVNGYPDRFEETKCSGVFVRHTWLAKTQTKDWFAHAIMQAVVPQLHRGFVQRMDELVIDWRDKTLRGSEMLG